MSVQPQSALLPQLTLERHQQAKGMFEIPIGRGIGRLPRGYYAGYPPVLSHCIRLAELLVQIIIRIMPFRLCIRKSSCQVLDEQGYGNRPDATSWRSEKVLGHQIDGLSPDPVQRRFDTRVGKSANENVSSGPQIIIRSDKSPSCFFEQKMK
jgi:hypothetical protein